MEKEMINVNVNDIAYAVKRDGSVINNFGDTDEMDCNESLVKAFKPICFAPYNILKAIADKKGKSSKEFCLALLGMLKHYVPSRKALCKYLEELKGFGEKSEEK